MKACHIILFEIHARAPVAGLAHGAAVASSGIGSMTVRSDRLTADRCGSVICIGADPPCRCIGTCSVVSHAGLTQGAAWRTASAALAPLAASTSTPTTLAARCIWCRLCVLTGMFRAHVNIFATRSHAE